MGPDEYRADIDIIKTEEKLQSLYTFESIPGTDLEVRVFVGGLDEGKDTEDDTFDSALRFTRKLTDIQTFKNDLIIAGVALTSASGLTIGGSTGLRLGRENSTTWGFNSRERMNLRYDPETKQLTISPIYTLAENSGKTLLKADEIDKIRTAYSAGKNVGEIVEAFKEAGMNHYENLPDLVANVIGNTIFVRDNIPTSKHQERLTNVHVIEANTDAPVSIDLSLPARSVDENFARKEAPALASVEIPTGFEYTTRGLQVALVFRKSPTK